MEEIMKTAMRKAAVIGLSACLALTSLAGCSKKDEFDLEAAALTVNGDVIPAGLVKFVSHYTQAGTEGFYSSYFGDNAFNQPIDESGTTLGSMVVKSSAATLKQMVLAEQKMEEYDIALTDEEKSAITEAATSFMDANGEEVLEKMGATQETVERYLTLCTIQNKMEPQMSADVDTEVSDEEAAQRKIEYTLFTAQTEAETESETGEASTEAESGAEDMTEAEGSSEAETAAPAGETETEAAETEAQTAALTENETTKTQSADETETEAAEDTTEATTAAAEDSTEAAEDATGAAEDATEAAEDATEVATEEETETETEDPAMAAAMEEAYGLAQQMIAKVEAGDDFEAAAQAVKEDATVHEMTFGADSTTVAEGLITATEGVADGTLITEPVKAASGYYVVRLVTQLDREATDEEKEKIVEQRKTDRISELYGQWEEDGEVSQDDDILAKIVFDFSLTPETEAVTEGTTEAATEAATEGTTEAATEAVTEGTTEAVTEGTTEATTEGATEAVTEETTEGATEAAAEDATEAVTEEVTEA